MHNHLYALLCPLAPPRAHPQEICWSGCCGENVPGAWCAPLPPRPSPGTPPSLQQPGRESRGQGARLQGGGGEGTLPHA
eukprot:285154-Chlamydomonas_euryale.AAC.6